MTLSKQQEGVNDVVKVQMIALKKLSVLINTEEQSSSFTIDYGQLNSGAD